MLRTLAQQLNRQTWISEAAYYLAEKRGFIPGQESTDWLQAEISYYEMLIAAYINILQEDGQMTVVGVRQLAELIGIEDADKLHSEAEWSTPSKSPSNTVLAFGQKPSASVRKLIACGEANV